jgi:hypothetical protein
VIAVCRAASSEVTAAAVKIVRPEPGGARNKRRLHADGSLLVASVGAEAHG